MTALRVKDLVEAHCRKWGDASPEIAIFGTADAEAVGAWYERFCVAAMQSRMSQALFFASSAGCVAGVELADGRRMVIKAYQPRWNLELLQAVWSAQTRLASEGFACPMPQIPPMRFAGVKASSERLLHDPGMRILEKDEFAVSAESFAQAASMLGSEDAQPWVDKHAMDRPSGSLYPIPHNPIFDFSLNVEDARWIDELAAAALVAQDGDDAPPRLLHGDWSARNIRIVDHRLVASYDWDSLGAFRESKGVGIAASAWRSTGEADDPAAPDSEEINAYLDLYIKAAGGSRSRRWRAAAVGAALYALAYTARCEHSLQARDGRDQRRRARDTLVADRGGFLSAVELP